MNDDELERSSHVLIGILSRHLPGGTEKNAKIDIKDICYRRQDSTLTYLYYKSAESPLDKRLRCA
jgi:hypothetical protein